MNAWTTLGLERTDRRRRRSAALMPRKLKAIDVDADPAAFIALRAALEQALSRGRARGRRRAAAGRRRRSRSHGAGLPPSRKRRFPPPSPNPSPSRYARPLRPRRPKRRRRPRRSSPPISASPRSNTCSSRRGRAWRRSGPRSPRRCGDPRPSRDGAGRSLRPHRGLAGGDPLACPAALGADDPDGRAHFGAGRPSAGPCSAPARRPGSPSAPTIWPASPGWSSRSIAGTRPGAACRAPAPTRIGFRDRVLIKPEVAQLLNGLRLHYPEVEHRLDAAQVSLLGWRDRAQGPSLSRAHREDQLVWLAGRRLARAQSRRPFRRAFGEMARPAPADAASAAPSRARCSGAASATRRSFTAARAGGISSSSSSCPCSASSCSRR